MPCRSSRKQGGEESLLSSSSLCMRGGGFALFRLSLSPLSLWLRLAWCSPDHLLLTQHTGRLFSSLPSSWTRVLDPGSRQAASASLVPKRFISVFHSLSSPNSWDEKERTLRWWRHKMARIRLPIQMRAVRPSADHDMGRLCLVKPLRRGAVHHHGRVPPGAPWHGSPHPTPGPATLLFASLLDTFHNPLGRIHFCAAKY